MKLQPKSIGTQLNLPIVGRNETMNIDKLTLPVALLRGMVALPHNEITFDAGRKETIAAVDRAMQSDKMIFLTSQKNPEKSEISGAVYEKIGVVGTVSQSMKLPGGVERVVVSCKYRGKIVSAKDDGYMSAEIDPIYDEYNDNDLMTAALVRELKNKYQTYFSINTRLTADSYMKLLMIENPSVLADKIAFLVPFNPGIKQHVLETSDIDSRLKFLISSLVTETELLNLQLRIEKEVKTQIDKNQREYFLREQLKVIEKELGDKDGSTGEMAEYRNKIAQLNLQDDISAKLNKEVDRLGKIGYSSPEAGVIRTYLDTVLSLPWNKKTKGNLDIEHAAKILDHDHYGLEKVKESVLLNLAIRNFNAKGSNILCLVGPPGVGKTSIAKSIASALGRNYVRISLGGVRDEADIRGHRKTYIGAMCGQIINAVIQADSNNALILLDEIDKVASDFRGDPAAALLEVLDNEQNHAFKDHYIEVPFDLSDIMFITTANTLDTISRPLLDRMDVIEISGYTRDEKLSIGKKYLFPKNLEKTGLKGKRITITDDALLDIIDYYTREAGVRRLEKMIIKILGKVAKAFLEENRKSFKITASQISCLLGKRIYSFEAKNSTDEVGIVRGLAWTAVGGETLSVEVNVMSGTGKVELTGCLGDVMKESAVAAISFLRSSAKKYNIPSFYKNKDIHIHVSEGAVPKDGPSAGITMATAVFSALTGKKIRSDVAMTGEITLRGRVLPIEGKKEKVLAAHRAGIKTVIFPHDNLKDIDDIPQKIRDEMECIPVKAMDEVLDNAVAK